MSKIIFNDAEFISFPPEKQKLLIQRYPAYILRLPKIFKNFDSCDDDNYIYALKKIALKQDGFLFLSFEENGLSVNQLLADIALTSYPELIKEVDERFLNENNIKKAILLNPALVASIPTEFMTSEMYSFCNRTLRKFIKKDSHNFRLLPEEVRSFSFSVTNAYTKNIPTNVLQLRAEALEHNGGKLMYKIVRREPDLLLCFAPEVWRKNLVLTAVTVKPEIFKSLPKEYQEDQLVQFRTYKALAETGHLELIDEYLSSKETDRARLKFLALSKRKEKQKQDNETVDAMEQVRNEEFI